MLSCGVIWNRKTFKNNTAQTMAKKAKSLILILNIPRFIESELGVVPILYWNKDVFIRTLDEITHWKYV